MRCRGTSSRHSTESVSNQNFTRDGEEFTKVLTAAADAKVDHIDNLLEFGKYCEELSWNHRTTTLHQSETSGIAERAARRIKEETSAVLLQSGSNHKWLDSMECYCCLRDDQDLLADGKSQNERRLGESFQDMLCSRENFGKKIL